MNKASPWFDEAFGKLYPVLYAHRDSAAAEREVDFLVRRTPLEKEDRILDLACGAGRHLAVLRGRGFQAFGVDRSEVLAGMAAEIVPGCVIRGDMRRIPFAAGTFDAVLNLFTSFGYFEDEVDDGRVLAQIARILKPSGRFVIDYLHAEHVRARLVPRSERQIRNYTVSEERSIQNGRVVKRVSIAGGGLPGTATWVESVRLLEPVQLETMLRFAGLGVRERFDGLDGGATGTDPRCVLVAERAP